jgi:hypothetical protein
MIQKPNLILVIAAIIACGIPGILSGLGGIFFTGFGLL